MPQSIRGDTMWRFIAPDKPIRTSEKFLPLVNNKDWFIEAKIDGWRCEIGNFNGNIHTIGRTGNKLDVPTHLVEQAKEIVPDGCAIDCEWINPTRIKAINTTLGCNIPLITKMVGLDITWHQGVYIGRKPILDRTALALYNALPTTTIETITDAADFVKSIRFDCSPTEAYKLQQSHPISEGLVVKRKSSKTVGRNDVSHKNPNWYKIKYR
jgi:ATP-dependent DNA ligase